MNTANLSIIPPWDPKCMSLSQFNSFNRLLASWVHLWDFSVQYFAWSLYFGGRATLHSFPKLLTFLNSQGHFSRPHQTPRNREPLKVELATSCYCFQSGFTSASHQGIYSNAYISVSSVGLTSCARSFCRPQLLLYLTNSLYLPLEAAPWAPGGQQYFLRALPLSCPVWRLSAITFGSQIMASHPPSTPP